MKRESIKKKSKGIMPKTAKTMRVSESLLNGLIDNNPYPIWISDEKGTLIKISKTSMDMFHLKKEEVLGKYNIFNDNIIAEQGHMPLVKRVFDSGETVRFEIKYDTSQLKHLKFNRYAFVIMNVTIFPVKNAKGKITNAVIQHIDISAQRQVEEELSNSVEQYRIITSTAMDGFAAFDIQGNIISVNEAFCHMTGYTKNELLTMTIKEIEAIETPAESEAHFQKVAKTGSDFFESRQRRKDGCIIDVEITACFSPQLGLLYTFQRDITERKRLETLLEEERLELKTFFDSSPISIFYKDTEGRILRANKTCCESFKMREEDLIGKTVFDFHPPEIAQGMMEEDGEIFRSGRPKFNIIQHYKFKTGIQWLQTDKVPTFDAQGNITGLISFMRDMTERKQAEDVLCESEEKLRTIMETTYEWIWDIDLTGRHTYSNLAIESILGYSPEEIMGRSAFSLMHDVDKEKIEKIFASCVEEKKGWHNLVIRWQHKDGTYHYLESNSIPIVNQRGELTGFRGTDRDITERKQAEEAMLHANERIKVMLDASPLAIFDLDTEGCVLSIWNPEAERMFGWTREEVLGRASPVVPEERKEEFLKILKDVNSGKVITGMDIRRRRKDGSLIDCSLYASPLYDSQGHIAGGIAIMADITERKKAEEALRLSEERFRHLVESLTDDIYSVKIDQNGTVVSTYGLRVMAITGYTLEEYNADPDLWFKIIYEEDRTIITDFKDRILAGETGLSFEYRIVHKNGSIRWVRNTPVSRFNSGQLIGYDGLVTDITERKHAEEALRESEKRFKRLVESITDYMYTVKIENGRPVFSSHSPGCIAVTGYTPEEFEAEQYLLYRMIYEDDKQIVKEQTEKVLSGQEAVPIEYRIIHKNGSIRWVKGMMVPRLINGRLAAYDGLITDITERKQSEESLRISEEKYRDIFERAMEGIFQINPEGRFINVNPSFASMLGYESPQELIATIIDVKNQLYVHPEDRMIVVNTINKHGIITGFEHQVYKKDGTINWMSINARGIMDQDGKVIYYEGTAEDITKNKKAEEERERLQSQLQQAQKMEAIGTFTGGVAHDFNNILSVFMGYATLLQMEIDQDNPLRNYADQLVSSAKKAATLTQSLLAFSRKQPVNLKPLKLNELITATEKLLKRLLTEDIVLKKNLAPAEITIMGDASQIDQILFNLATNARDAMPKGGILSIETRLIKVDGGYLHLIGGKNPGTYALLSFSDTGTGIDKKIIDQIFDPFFTTKEVGKGTGLGLSTVYGIVKQHGGFINVYSEDGKGTTFHIYFPTAPETVEEEKPAAVPIIHGKEKIIIAEDNESLRLLMEKVLTKYGYTIIEAVDGQDAITKYKKNKNIDLMILDSVMPKKNGREVYDEILKINPDIKVLFTSGYTRDIVLDKGIEEKEVDFISKPITPNALLEKVREVLDRKEE